MGSLLNVKYAHLDDEALVKQVLLKDSNPLAVELAKRFNFIEDYDCQHECDRCDENEEEYQDLLQENKELKQKLKSFDL